MIREQLERYLQTEWAGRTALCFDVLDSTNSYAKELLQKQPVHGWLITADTQTAGKGRRGRQWTSPAGSSISMSLCLEPEIKPENAAGLTLVMALAAAEGIRECAGIEPLIKWPNDLVLNGKKVCGILTEMCIRKERFCIVIGVGVNVNVLEFPKELTETATSLFLETGEKISREQLAASILKHFERDYEVFLKTEDLSQLKERYEARLVNRGRKVQVLDARQPYEGTASGINDAGNLIVEDADGVLHEVWSGEVSVRGVYGYV